MAIVALYGLDRSTKLRVHIGKKVRERGKSIGFKTKQKCPSIVGEIIDKNEITFVTRYTSDRGCPKITMY
jgi:hypothetical protein